jgi:ankyrin repeat protein
MLYVGPEGWNVVKVSSEDVRQTLLLSRDSTHIHGHVLSCACGVVWRMMQELLRFGADLDAEDRPGRSLLFWATLNERTEVGACVLTATA